MRELKVVTLEELKMQMREDFCEEDELINLYGAAAEDAVMVMLPSWPLLFKLSITYVFPSQLKRLLSVTALLFRMVTTTFLFRNTSPMDKACAPR